ncbi:MULTISPECIES: acyclic terpene utilization AtuA family protein [Carboxydocella]|nr:MULTISPECIES: acyclic terpene utilization AtuA family protein [Carboxydocella]
MKEMRILSPTAILGYGFPEESFRRGLEYRPHLIAVDAGSTDPGPYYLGAGVSFTDRRAVKRDLKLMLTAGLAAGVPVVVGTAGGSGATPHLEWTVDIVREIAREEGLRFRLAVIGAEQSREQVQTWLAAGKITPLHPAPPLTAEAVAASSHIVAQMGTEPFIAALAAGAQVIIAGRAYDPAVFAALAIKEGFDPGLAIHLGKILECAAIAAVPGSGSDCMFGWLREEHFEVEPLSPERRCSVTSVAAHTLYEKTDPYRLPGPGGILDLTATRFTQVGERRVRVTGSKHNPTPLAFKLEGARQMGYRTVSIAGARDPIFIARLDEILAGVRQRVKDNFRDIPGSEYFLHFNIYGRNGVMGPLEPTPTITSHEIGIVIEAVAPTQELANTICGFARSTLLHYGYEGRISTAGNLAFPYSPSDFKAGPVYQFSLYHLVQDVSWQELFPIHYEEIGGGGNG